MSKKWMNIWYKKVLDEKIDTDIHKRILYIVNKESMLWEKLNEKIYYTLKKNKYKLLLYFRLEPVMIYDSLKKKKLMYKIRNGRHMDILCEVLPINLKFKNPILWSWDYENDTITEDDYNEEYWNNNNNNYNQSYTSNNYINYIHTILNN